jgi:hypothetical protein
LPKRSQTGSSTSPSISARSVEATVTGAWRGIARPLPEVPRTSPGHQRSNTGGASSAPRWAGVHAIDRGHTISSHQPERPAAQRSAACTRRLPGCLYRQEKQAGRHHNPEGVDEHLHLYCVQGRTSRWPGRNDKFAFGRSARMVIWQCCSLRAKLCCRRARHSSEPGIGKPSQLTEACSAPSSPSWSNPDLGAAQIEVFRADKRSTSLSPLPSRAACSP